MLRMILNLLVIFISLNHLIIEIKAGNNGSFRRMRVGAASHSSRVSTNENPQARPTINNINPNFFSNDLEVFFQHLLIYEPERPSQNSHIQPEESHGIGQVAQTTATINRDHPMPGIGNIEMPQGQASSSSALSSDDSNNVVTSDCSICLESLLASEDVKELLACRHRFHRNCIDTWLINNATCPICRHKQVAHNDRPYEFVSEMRSFERLDN